MLLDCSGVGDDYEVTVEADSGFLEITTISAGSVAGSFSGLPLETTLEATIDVSHAASGVRVTGDIAVTLAQVAKAARTSTNAALLPEHRRVRWFCFVPCRSRSPPLAARGGRHRGRP